MDWTTVIVALLSCLGTGIGSLYGIKRSTSLIEYRITELEKKVDKHNNVIERTYKLEERAAVAEQDIKVANHRISDLEARNHEV
jgi:uncharacterized coiled-coil protein SlyX